MALELKQQLKLSQQLVMTPQLQQAIKLLQLSRMELVDLVREEMVENPVLEEVQPEGPDEAQVEAEAAEAESRDTEEVGEKDPFEDFDFDAYFHDYLDISYQPRNTEIPELPSYEATATKSPSLAEHLLWQLNLTRMSEQDRLIALTIIDTIDDAGRLTSPLEDLLELFPPEEEVGIEELTAVLHALQQFEPAGVFAADLSECLLLQLRQLPPDTPWIEQARVLINRHCNQLAGGDYAQIMRRMKLPEDDLRSVLRLVKSLDPFPGKRIGADDTEYIVPDVYVTRSEGTWVVQLNLDSAPKLRINDHYAGMIKRADNSADNNYLRDNLQEARWFLKSLQSRNETLMKVASEIVRRQRNFLQYGEEAMRPLVLADIAEAVEMHESTISRVTTRKYMHTPRGIFELKYFFSSHVATTAGGACSSTAIRALIRKLIAAENPRKPLSDSKLAELLEDQGIQVARRTIAKYRDTLLIPPSNERKRLV